MCRNITILRGLEPAATREEIEAAARQYVRKVSGVQSVSAASEAAFELAVRRVTEATTELLRVAAAAPSAADHRPAAAPPPQRLTRLGQVAAARLAQILATIRWARSRPKDAVTPTIAAQTTAPSPARLHLTLLLLGCGRAG